MQDMLDTDIRSEVATVVGGVNEFTSLMDFDLPSLDLESNSTDGDLNYKGLKWPLSNTTDICADVGACVNPNSVMPVSSGTAILLKSPKSHLNLNRHHMSDSMLVSPYEKKSHLTFSPSTIKLSQMNHEYTNKKLMCISAFENNRENVKKDLNDDLVQDDVKKVNGVKVANGYISPASGQNNLKNVKLSNHLKIINNTISNINQQQQKIQRESSPKINFLNQALNVKMNQKYSNINGSINKTSISNNININNNINLTNNSSISVKHSKLSKNHNSHNGGNSENTYPKPGYSYSCLIAMALKNSRAGSLPVSEIYSFMCEHFPYFKTAPNGWKNSVRHNLSLNKCFEKIEKPVSNGGQRKGCLWAMNPSKISKMDEEVMKWSRKDPMAIKKAMVYPENLEALERGEMKHGHSGESDDEDVDGVSEENDETIQSDGETEEGYAATTPESCDNNRPINGENGSTNEEEPDVDFDIEVSLKYMALN
jgi:hypothetical protein